MLEDYNSNRAEIDALADKAFDNTAAPHPILDISVWHLLTVAEDRVRMFFAGWIQINEAFLFNFIDSLKYSLKHSMLHVIKKSDNEKITLPKKTNPKVYEKAGILINSAEKYETFCRLIASTYNKKGRFLKESDSYNLDYNDIVDIRYSVLEVLGHGADITPDITSIIYHWLNSDIYSYEEIVVKEKINDSVRLKNGKVNYSYLSHIAYGIAKKIPQRDIIIPDDFVFSWGAGNKTLALINSLLVRCFYHVLTIQIATDKFKVKGGAESSLVLILTKEQLCLDIQQLADFSDSDVYQFINILTFGNKTTTPDIALQPLFVSKSGVLMIPCYHILSSNLQRNLLTLKAKIDSNNFDSQSACFEKYMVSKIQLSLKKWENSSFNKEFKVNGEKEEIDGLVLDEANQTILLMELRWILQPGDVREVYNKIKVTSSKVDQLSRKVDFVKRNLSEIVQRSFGDSIKMSKISEWKVEGVVIIQGFGGTASHSNDIPIVTTDVFCKGINWFNDLHNFYIWLRNLSWLPIEGKHFSVETIIENNGLVKVSRKAARILVNQRQYTESLQKNILENATT